MGFFEKLSQLWDALCAKVSPWLKKVNKGYQRFRHWLGEAWFFVRKTHKIILAVPVAVAAVMLAVQNLARLPRLVGLNLQGDGSFTMYIGRLPAVLGPLVITAVCLLLMFGSKRTLTPWLVSVFSLALPLIILVINVFPA